MQEIASCKREETTKRRTYQLGQRNAKHKFPTEEECDIDPKEEKKSDFGVDDDTKAESNKNYHNMNTRRGIC